MNENEKFIFNFSPGRPSRSLPPCLGVSASFNFVHKLERRLAVHSMMNTYQCSLVMFCRMLLVVPTADVGGA